MNPHDVIILVMDQVPLKQARELFRWYALSDMSVFKSKALRWYLHKHAARISVVASKPNWQESLSYDHD